MCDFPLKFKSVTQTHGRRLHGNQTMAMCVVHLQIANLNRLIGIMCVCVQSRTRACRKPSSKCRSRIVCHLWCPVTMPHSTHTNAAHTLQIVHMTFEVKFLSLRNWHFRRKPIECTAYMYRSYSCIERNNFEKCINANRIRKFDVLWLAERPGRVRAQQFSAHFS